MRIGLLGGLLACAGLACAPLSVSQEQRLGYQVAYQLSRELRFLPDRAVQAYVQEIGEDILRAAGPQPFRYTFYVVQDPEINAFAAPAGHVYVQTGILLAARNASELAGILAHEIGHVVLRHIAKNYTRAEGAQLGSSLLGLGVGMVAGGLAGSAAQLGGDLAALGYLNRFGREAELEADAFAVKTLLRASYHPEGLVTFFETLRREDSEQSTSFLSSHPATDERIHATREDIAALPTTRGLYVNDGGRFEIIQERVRLLTQGRR